MERTHTVRLANLHGMDGTTTTLSGLAPLISIEELSIGAVLIGGLQKAAQPKQGERRREPKMIAGLKSVADAQ